MENKYGLPNGRLYLAYCDNELAGCIGLKKIDDKNCEMKLLYVRPKFRGKHIGDSYMLLDTLLFYKMQFICIKIWIL